MFDTTFTYASHASLPPHISLDAALSLLHDFDTIMRLNPDCRGCELVSSYPSPQTINETREYIVQDRISFIPEKLWSGGVSYTALFTPREDGCEILVKAPGGFTSTNKWRMVQGQDGLEIRLTSDAECSKAYSKFVKKYLEGSHEQLQRGFQERLLERMGAEGPSIRNSMDGVRVEGQFVK